MDRSSSSTSPYLRQHAENPVDWWEWGDEAFAEARRRDVPVLLSVGCAACHWCHVMARESYEDPTTAAEMDAGFVSVKVDREERPDVDAAHMSATQALTGRGGWPMTVFLTPDGRPFCAGTSVPPGPVQGAPAFRQVLAAVTESWGTRRDDAGTRISAALARRSVDTGPRPVGAAELVGAVEALAREEDPVHGGFGGAPTFPPSAVLELLLLRHAAAPGAPQDSRERALGLAERALRAMARSGTHDQLAGGFARYTVDAGWVVPHVEKMLHDNAQLARTYPHWRRLTGSPLGRRVAVETCDWMLAALGTAEGGSASSLDADTPLPGEHHGVEGLTHVWTPAELVAVLGADDGAWAAELLGVTPAGTVEHGASMLRLLRDVLGEDPPDAAAPGGVAPGRGPAGGAAPDPVAAGGAAAAAPEAERWRGVRARLLEARALRPQPGRDDEVVAAWNGLAVAALAEVGALCGRPDLVEAARRCAALLVDVHRTAAPADGSTGAAVRWRRASRDGAAGPAPAVLEDHGDLAEGFLARHAVTGEARWAAAAGELLDDVLDRFADGPVLRDTAADEADPRLAALARPSDPTDGAAPSGTSAAAQVLLTRASLTGSTRHRAAALAALGATAALAGAAPRFAGWGLAAAQAALEGPLEVAVVGARDDPAADALHRTALAGTSPGLVVVRGEPGAAGVELLADRPLAGGRAAAHVCRGQVCEAPTTDVDALAAAVR